jgi:ATP/ADP translocase
MAASQRHVQLQGHTEYLVILTEHHLGCLQVFAKGAKFSMFKPAEEMVYIGLDEQSRTKGKAAIDVAGAQTGKSMGSVLQQVVKGNTCTCNVLLLQGQHHTAPPACCFFGVVIGLSTDQL